MSIKSSWSSTRLAGALRLPRALLLEEADAAAPAAPPGRCRLEVADSGDTDDAEAEAEAAAAAAGSPV